jgi:superoxide reductase
MTAIKQIYKCEVCGNIIEVLHSADGELVCCGEPMKLFEENTVDAAKEKHVPMVESISDGVRVKVGSDPHPMEESHYIEWIEIVQGEKYCRQFLKPGQKPEAVFNAPGSGTYAREYCNKHGLWKS